MILVIDNYDSFTFNLVHYLQELGAEVRVERNDALTAREAVGSGAKGILLSPGPRTPNEAGITLDTVAACADAGLPLLGVCLGHQAIGQHFGGRVVQGGLMHGIQLWVNLPRSAKMSDPRYQDIRSGEVRLLTTPDAGTLVRVIAGTVDGHAGPGATYTPMSLVHATVEPGARLDLPWDVEHNALVYVLSGQGSVGVEGRPVRTGQTAVLGAGDYLSVSADARQDSRTPALDVVVLGGRPIREALAWAGPFVMNTRAEVMEAYQDFQSGRFGHVPA